MDWQLRMVIENDRKIIIPIHGTYKDALRTWGRWSNRMFSKWKRINSAEIYRVKKIGSREFQEKYFIA